MGFLNMLAGLIIKEPISSGIAKFTETIGERVANIFIDALPDGSKKHFENAAAITSESIEINGLDKNDIKDALMDAFKEFNKQTNVTLKIPDFMQAVFDALSKSSKKIDFKFAANRVCNNLYEHIMEESDANGGDKLKEQFKAAREVYVEKNRKAIELNNIEKYGSPNAEISEEKSYNYIVVSFAGETILPKEFFDELKNDVLDSFNGYDLEYNYDGLGNCLSFNPVFDEDEGGNIKNACAVIIALLDKYHADKESILIYVNEVEPVEEFE